MHNTCSSMVYNEKDQLALSGQHQSTAETRDRKWVLPCFREQHQRTKAESSQCLPAIIAMTIFGNHDLTGILKLVACA